MDNDASILPRHFDLDDAIPDSQLCEVEQNSPDIDWKFVWFNARLKCLDSEVSSFAWKLLHSLLPTKLNLSRVLRNTTSHHKFAHLSLIDFHHEQFFFKCPTSQSISPWLYHLVHQDDNQTTISNIINTNISVLDGFIWIILQSLKFMWDRRPSNKDESLCNCKS